MNTMQCLRYALAASVAACLFGGVAVAQNTPAASPATSAAPDAAQNQPVTAPAAPAAADAATQASAITVEPANALVTVTTDADGVRHMLITSPPVPDTPENRARYGRPLSNAGERTQAAGN
jgi:hypothetical protein